MKRTILTADQFAALARRTSLPQWTQQPLQQHFAEGDGDGGDGGGDDGNDGAGDGDGSGDGDGTGDGDGDGDEDKKLGPAGEKALAAIKAKEKSERTRRIAAEKELKALKAGKKPGASGGDDAAEQAQREREEQIIARANARVLSSEVRAAAAGVLADPADAPRFIDLDQFEVGENGSVDATAIADAIKELVEDKPYLAAQGGTGKSRIPNPDKRQGGGGGRKLSGKDLGKAEAAKRFGNRDKK